MVLKCSEVQRELIKKFHEWQFAHSGVDRTIALLTKGTPTVLGIKAQHSAKDAGAICYTTGATRRAHRTSARKQKEGETGKSPGDRNRELGY